MISLHRKEFIRNSAAIAALLLKKENTFLTKEEIKIIIPARYVDKELAFIEHEQIRTVAIFAIVDSKNNYTVVNAPIFIPLSPSDIEDAIIDGEQMKVLSFEPFSVVMPNTICVKSEQHMYDLYDEFITKGNVPWFMNYLDFSNLFARAKMFAGSKIGANRPVLEILAANVARNSKNLKQLYRYAIKSIDDINKIPMYPVGLGNVYLSRTSTISAISGGHLSDGIINKINNPEDQPTLLGTKLSGKETA